MGHTSRLASCVVFAALVAAVGASAGCSSGSKSTPPQQTGGGGGGGGGAGGGGGGGGGGGEGGGAWDGAGAWSGVGDPWTGSSGELLSIASDAVVLAPDYVLSGTVAAGVTAVSVALNGQAPRAATLAGTRFTLPLTLSPGVNGLALVATDGAGAHPSLQAAVRYEDGTPSTASLIAAALTAGTITPEQALSYRVYAAFGDARLPAEFRGSGTIDGSNVIQQLWDVIGTLSPATYQALVPYLIPDFYVQGGGAASAQRAGAHASLTLPDPWCTWFGGGSDCDLDPSWVSTSGPHIKVWWKNTHPEDEEDAGYVRELIEDRGVWDDLAALLGHEPAPDGTNGGDARLDIILTEMGGQPGVTVTAGSCQAPCSAFIRLQRKPAGPGYVFDAAVHELMHAFTWGGTLGTGKLVDYVSLSEATATWAANRYRPTDNWEHRYNSYWMDRPERGLFSVTDPGSDLFTYGTWIFYAWYWKQLGDPDLGDLFISRIWKSAAYMTDQAQIVDQAIRWLKPFTGNDDTLENVWPRFVADAWNGGDAPALWKLDKIRARPRFSEDTDVVSAYDFPVEATMTAPGARYYRWRFQDPNVRTLLFLDGAGHRLALDTPTSYWATAPGLFGLTDAQKKGVVVQGRKWEARATWTWTDPESWTTAKPPSRWDPAGHASDIGYAFICRDARDVRQLDVAISYADVSSPGKELAPLGDPPRLVASSDPCFNLAASASTVQAWSDDMGSSTWRYAYEGELQSFDLMLDAAGSGTTISGISFSGQTTKLAWSMDASDTATGCTSSGSGAVPPPTDMSPAFVYAWAGAPYAHGVDWAGFSAYNGDPPPDQSYTVTCPPPPPPPPDPNDPNPPPPPEPTTTTEYFTPVGFGLMDWYSAEPPEHQAVLRFNVNGVMHIDLATYFGYPELTGLCELKVSQPQ